MQQDLPAVHHNGSGVQLGLARPGLSDDVEHRAALRRHSVIGPRDVVEVSDDADLLLVLALPNAQLQRPLDKLVLTHIH